MTHFDRSSVAGKTYNYDSDFIRNTVLFSADEKAQLAEVAQACAGADFFKNQGFLNRFEFEFALTTARIEGSSISPETVRSVITNGAISDFVLMSDINMVANLADAFRYIAHHDLEVSMRTASEMHQLLAQRLIADPSALGGMKPTNNEVIGGIHYIPLEPTAMLKAEMQVLFDTYNSLDDPFDRALYIHNNLAYMQYFLDCNKRTARAMQLISMKHDGITPLILIDNNSRQLYRDYTYSLISYYAAGDYGLSKEFFITNYKRVGEEIADRLVQKEVQEALSQEDCFVIAKGKNNETNSILEQIGTVKGPSLARCYLVRKERLLMHKLDLQGYKVFLGVRNFIKKNMMSEQEIEELLGHSK